MKKHCLTLSLLLASALVFTGCGDTTKNNHQFTPTNNIWANTDSDKFLKACNQEVLENLSILTKDDAYISVIMNHNEMLEMANSLKDVEINPNKNPIVYNVDKHDALISSLFLIPPNELSETGKKVLARWNPTTLLSPFISRSGATALAVSSSLRYNELYIDNYNTNNQLWIYQTTDENVQIFVSFSNSGKQILSVTAGYIFGTAPDLTEYLNDMGL